MILQYKILIRSDRLCLVRIRSHKKLILLEHLILTHIRNGALDIQSGNVAVHALQLVDRIRLVAVRVIDGSLIRSALPDGCRRAVYSSVDGA